MKPGRATSTIGDGLGAEDALGDGGGDVHGGHAHGAGESEGDVAGVVAVVAFFGALDSQLDRWDWRECGVGLRELEGVADQFSDQISGRARHFETAFLARQIVTVGA